MRNTMTSAGWNREVVEGPEAIVRLAAADVEFPLSDLYERVGE